MKAIIVDYGMGNVASVQKVLDVIGINSIISNNLKDFEESNFIILPGVGSFKQGIENLHKFDLVNTLNEEVLVKKKPFLGICLGMQLIASNGTEHGISKGLGWITGDVNKIESNKLRVPHLGWNNLISEHDSFFQKSHNKDFYFIHSYHFDVKSEIDVAYVSYGQKYVAALKKANIVATQFHPEKSQEQGLDLIKKFINNYA